MRSDVHIALSALFPRGAIPEGDEKAEALVGACAGEFEYVNALAIEVTSSTPADGPLKERYLAMGFRAIAKWAETFMDTNGNDHRFVVSNNLGHLNSLFPAVLVSARPNEIVVHGLQNARIRARSGALRSGMTIASIVRDDVKIRVFETTKHAHVRAIYEEQVNA